MKRLLLLVFPLLMGSMVFAQGTELQLAQGALKDALTQAGQVQKKVFVVGYSKYSPESAWDASSLDSKTALSTYLNEHFVNYRIEMTSGDGPAFGEKYPWYPLLTYYFLSAQGDLVEYTAADLNADELLAFAKRCEQGGYETLPMQKAKFDQGNRDLDFLYGYWKSSDERKVSTLKVLEAFQSVFKGSELLRPSMWEMFSSDDYLHGMYNLYWKIEGEPVEYLLSHTAEFNAKYGESKVEETIAALYLRAIQLALETGDQAGYEAAFKKAEMVDNKSLSYLVDSIRIRQSEALENWEVYCDAVDHMRAKRDVPLDQLNNYAEQVLRGDEVSENSYKRALVWSNACVMGDPQYWYLHTNACLWHVIGKDKKAKSVANKAFKAAKKSGEDPRETRDAVRSWD